MLFTLFFISLFIVVFVVVLVLGWLPLDCLGKVLQLPVVLAHRPVSGQVSVLWGIFRALIWTAAYLKIQGIW